MSADDEINMSEQFEVDDYLQKMFEEASGKINLKLDIEHYKLVSP